MSKISDAITRLELIRERTARPDDTAAITLAIACLRESEARIAWDQGSKDPDDEHEIAVLGNAVYAAEREVDRLNEFIGGG